MSKYVKLPALLGTGYFFSCSLHFFCSFLKRESARIASKVRVSCRGEATSQSWSSLTVSLGLAGGEGGEGPKEKVPHQRGQVQGPGHGHRHRLLGGGAEREGNTEPEAGSRLQAVSTEPDAGLEPTDHEIMT